MRISEAFDYPAPADEVFEMMTTEAFLEQVCEATYAVSHSVEVTEVGGTITVVVHRELPTDGFPDFARGLVGPTISAVQTIAYAAPTAAGVRVGDMHIELGMQRGAPIQLTAQLVLTPSGERTQVRIEGELVCSIPLVGSKIEQAASRPVVAGIHKEREVGLDWLEAAAAE